MRAVSVRLLMAGALAVSALPSAFAQGLFDDSEARRRIDTLRQQMDANQRSIDERLAKMEGGSSRDALLDLSSQLEALRNDLARMRGQLEMLTNQAENADKRQKDFYLDIDTRLRKLEQTGEQAGGERKPSAEAEPSAAENKAYTAALDQFKLGNYPLAVSAMQGFLVTYPTSTLAANAQYWVGMAYSGQRDYKNSIAAQRKLLQTWPDSPKAPDAMLSIASAQETMGDRKAAQKSLEDLVGKYPSSSAATSAKQRLAAFSRR